MKPNTIILQTGARFIIPLQVLFSIFLLLRGHNEPGGGFIAGLVVSGAFVLYLFAFGVESARKLLRVDPRDILAFGLLLALAAGLAPLAWGRPLLTGLWGEVPVVGLGIATPIVFDVGVYFAVMGTVLTLVFGLAEAEE